MSVLDEVMTAGEVATVYGLADATVRQAINRKSIPARKSGGTWLLAKSDIEKRWGQPPQFPALAEFDACSHFDGDNGSYYYLTLRAGGWIIIDNVRGGRTSDTPELESIKYEIWREWITRDDVWDVIGKLPDVPHEILDSVDLFEEDWIWQHVGCPPA